MGRPIAWRTSRGESAGGLLHLQHCPYVLGSDEVTRATVDRFKGEGVAFIGINSNSETTHPTDDFTHMVERMKAHNFPWVYARDSPRPWRGPTGPPHPHFYVFDRDRRLVYTGGNGPTHATRPRAPSTTSTGAGRPGGGRPVRTPLTNPIGCNVKWEDRTPTGCRRRRAIWSEHGARSGDPACASPDSTPPGSPARVRRAQCILESTSLPWLSPPLHAGPARTPRRHVSTEPAT